MKAIDSEELRGDINFWQRCQEIVDRAVEEDLTGDEIAGLVCDYIEEEQEEDDNTR